ncbi:MAG: hypothetical protein EOO96_13105 [Pedobacter sp.]|nr:MAG: hypothetical protein EOO96_13105 [Pedobacter sp.]
MSEISEKCYSAGWVLNLEYVLWDALTSGPRKYGHDLITEKDIKILKELSLKTKGWVMFDNSSEDTYIEKELWEIKFSKAINQNPHILM